MPPTFWKGRKEQTIGILPRSPNLAPCGKRGKGKGKQEKEKRKRKEPIAGNASIEQRRNVRVHPHYRLTNGPLILEGRRAPWSEEKETLKSQHFAMILTIGPNIMSHEMC